MNYYPPLDMISLFIYPPTTHLATKSDRKLEGYTEKGEFAEHDN